MRPRSPWPHSCPSQSPGPGISVAPGPSPGQRAGGGARDLRERARAGAGVHTPQGQGRSRRSGPALGGVTGPRPHLRVILVCPVPPPPPSARPESPARSRDAGPAVSSTGPRRPLLASVRRRPPGCPSVRAVGPRGPGPGPLWAFSDLPPLRAPAPRVVSGRSWRDAPPGRDLAVLISRAGCEPHQAA